MVEAIRTVPVACLEEMSDRGSRCIPLEVKQYQISVFDKIRQNWVPDLSRIEQALNIASFCEGGKKRKNLDPSITHQLAVMGLIAGLGIPSEDIYIKAALHDTPENTAPNKKPLPFLGSVRAEDLGEVFGEGIGIAINLLSKVKKVNDATVNDRTHLKILSALATDIDVILIKLADRLEILRTINALSARTQQIKAHETLDLYFKLAMKLGMHSWAREMVEHSMRVLNGEEKILALLKRYGELYPPEFIDYLSSLSQQANIWSGIPIANIAISTRNFIFWHYQLNGEEVDPDQDKFYLPWEVVISNQDQPNHFKFYVYEFIKRFMTQHGGDFYIKEEDILEALKQEVDGILYIAVSNNQGQVIQFRFISERRLKEEEASIVDLYTKPRESLEFEIASQKVAKLRDVLARINTAGRHSRKDIIREFLRDLEVNIIKVTSSVDGKVYVFPANARVIDFAYAAGDRIGAKTISADVYLTDGTLLEAQPLDFILSPDCSVKLNLQEEVSIDDAFIARLRLTQSEYTRERIAERIRETMRAEERRKVKAGGQNVIYGPGVESPITDTVRSAGLTTLRQYFAQKAKAKGIWPGELILNPLYSRVFDRRLRWQRYINFLELVGLMRIVPQERRGKVIERLVDDLVDQQANLIRIDILAPDSPGISAQINSVFGGWSCNIEYEISSPHQYLPRVSLVRRVIKPDMLGIFNARIRGDLERTSGVQIISVTKLSGEKIDNVF